MTFYLVLGIIIVIILYFIPIELLINYQRKDNDDNLVLQFKVFILHYNLKLSLIDFKHLFSFPTTKLKGKFRSLFFDTNIEFKEELSESEIEYLKKYTKIMKRIISRFELVFLLTHNCSFFSWESSFGFSNPAYTGLLTGILWSIKGTIISILQTELKFKKLPLIVVKPNFNKVEPLKVEFKGIFTFRLGKLIVIGFQISYFELKRRAKIKWKNTRSLN